MAAVASATLRDRISSLACGMLDAVMFSSRIPSPTSIGIARIGSQLAADRDVLAATTGGAGGDLNECEHGQVERIVA